MCTKQNFNYSWSVCDRLCVSAEQFYSQREVTCSHIREMGQQCPSNVEIKYSEPLCVADKTCVKTR